MEPATYFGYIETIRHDPALIQQEMRRLDSAIAELSHKTKTAISPTKVPGLIWALTTREIARISAIVDNPSNQRVSDLAGQSRHLKALAASVPFESLELSEDPELELLLEQCDRLWIMLAHRQMIEGLLESPSDDDRRGFMARSMSLVSAFELELSYVEQVESRLDRIFGPFSKTVIEPAIGLSVAEIAAGMLAVRRLVMERHQAAYGAMRPMYESWQEFRRLCDSGASDKELSEFMTNHPNGQSICDRFRTGHEELTTIFVFLPADLELQLGDKSSRFFEEFAFTPGEVNQSYATPFDQDVVRRRPFARLPDNKFLLFDFYYSPFSPLYRLEELFHEPSTRKQLLRNRDRLLESEAVSLLSTVVQPSVQVANYYVSVGPSGTLAERDALFVRDGVAIIGEFKAKPLRDVSEHRGNVVKIESDVKKTIQDAYEQACSVIQLLRSKDLAEVTCWSSDKLNKTAIASINTSDINDAIPVIVLDSDYGLIATDLEPWLELDPDIGFPWVVHRDALESILRLIDTFPRFVEFLRWRRSLHGRVINPDEAVFAGFYIYHGSAVPPSGYDLVQLDQCYSDVFDADYFRRKGHPIEFDFPKETRPPVWTSITRDGDSVSYRIDGKLRDSINLVTGESRQQMNLRRRTQASPSQYQSASVPTRKNMRPSRNGLCPCGSGKKYKHCCLRDR
jgi:hypothetical protein